MKTPEQMQAEWLANNKPTKGQSFNKPTIEPYTGRLMPCDSKEYERNAYGTVVRVYKNLDKMDITFSPTIEQFLGKEQ